MSSTLGKALLVTSLVGGLGFGSLAFADGHYDGHYGERPEKPGHIMEVLRELDLNDSQRAEIKARMEKQDRESKTARMQELKSMRGEMMDLAESDGYSKKKAKKIANRMADKQAEMALERVERHHEFYKMLNPEQRAKLTKLRKEREEKFSKERWGERDERRGHDDRDRPRHEERDRDHD